MQQTGKPEIVFTLPACMGGVASFNYNIVNYSKLIGNFHSKVILIRAKEDNRPLFKDSFKADEVITFNYSYKENQYHVQKRLNDLLGSGEGAVITDNGLTIQAARRFNNTKTVFHLLHDYFYVSQNIQYGNLIDVAVAHSSFFSDAVYAADPQSFAGRNFYIPYGVKQLQAMPEKNNVQLRLVFLGRLEHSKGVMLLHDVETLLKAQNIQVQWTIIGKGPLKQQLQEQWEQADNVSFFEPDSTGEVYTLLAQQDIFVFPTSFEGTPVSILESLANAVVTIVNDLPGGIRDIVQEGIGYRVPLNDTEAFAGKIALLHQNRSLLQQMQKNCFELAQKNYDILQNADHYFSLFLEYTKWRRAEKKAVISLDRLDKKYMPNRVVKIVRQLK
ncbi:MAG TPA: glycosyltransferase [Ferruginibacter sp.]|nr:glycosyltransferase [Ferruginibacter sp.]HPH89841.1 glycosyltransferase [Ferruginibacter sp.]